MTYIVKIKRWLLSHIQNNFLIYFILTGLFSIGIIIGAITIKVLNIDQKDNIIVFLNSFFKIMSNNGLDNVLIFKQSIIDNFKIIGSIWITGLIIIGIVVIPLIITFRGFAIGFTVGFIVQEYSLKGFLFSILGILPQNLFIIPGLIFISSLGVVFSLKNVRKRRRKQGFNYNILEYSLLILFFSIPIFIGTLIEGFISPIFLGLLFDFIQ